jgi:hypothetical protein
MNTTSDAGYIITAYDYYTGANDREFCRIIVIKTDSNGVIEWQKAYTRSGVNITPLYDVQQVADGGYVLAGRTGYFNTYDGFIMKITSVGTPEWIWLIDVNGGRDYASEILETIDGGLFVAGCTDIWGTNANTVWLLKIKDSGDTDWWKKFSAMNEASARIGIRQTIDRGFVVGVPSSGNSQIVKVSETGTVEWQKVIGGSSGDIPKVVGEQSNADILVMGETWSYGGGSSDIWITRHQSDGLGIWQKAYGGNSTESCISAEITGNGDIIVAGTTTSFGDGTQEIWVLRIPSDGVLVGAPFVLNTSDVGQTSTIMLTDIAGGTSLGAVSESTISLVSKDSTANVRVQYY